MLKIIKKYKFLILAIIFAVPSVLVLVHPGFPLTDDGNWMVIRLSAFYEALRSGQFPVRYLLRLNNGYGYPVADFLYPLFLYIGSFIHLFRFDFVTSVKIILGLSLLLSSAFTYLWLRKSFGNLASFAGALVYTFFPYHLVDVYKRGSVGEVLSLTIVPFILLQIERRSLFYTSLGVFLLILSHNTLALLFIPVLFIYGLMRNFKSLKFLLVSFFLGLISASFFIIPALYDLQFTVFGNTPVSDFYNYFLNPSTYGYLASIFAILLLASVYLSFRNGYRKNWFFVFSVVASLLILFLVLPVSSGFWSLVPFKGLIQFPFRLISLVLVFSSFQAAVLIQSVNSKKRIRISIAALIVLLVFVCAFPYLTNINYQYFPDTFYSTNMDTTTVKNEYMPKWVKNVPVSYPSQRVSLKGNAVINGLLVSDRKISFQTDLSSETKATINVIYFPGWKAFVNGKQAKISYNNPAGLISLNLGKGISNVKVVFKETNLRLLADMLTIIGLAGIFALSYYKRNKNKFL